MKRPIAYKIPTLIEGIKTPQAKEAMEEWKEWLAYANYLESLIKQVRLK